MSVTYGELTTFLGRSSAGFRIGGVIEVLALDFDGVVAASAPETFLVAAGTFARTAPGSPLLARLPRPVPGALRPPDPEDPVYVRFLDALPLGNRAEDFAVVLRAIEAGAPLPDQAAYDRFKAGIDPDWLRTFHRRFYEVRRTFSQADPEGWLALVPAYPGVPERLRRLAGTVQPAVATARDGTSVRRLLEAYGIGDLIPGDRLLDKETGRSKRAHIGRLLELTAARPESLLFVDDKVNHLESVAGMGVRCALAGWGYNGPREHRRAGQMGFPVLEIADLEAGALERAVTAP